MFCFSHNICLFLSCCVCIVSSVRSGQIRNPDSASVSFPGQLKRFETGLSATSELDRGTALVGGKETGAKSSSLLITTPKKSSTNHSDAIAEEAEEDAVEEETRAATILTSTASDAETTNSLAASSANYSESLVSESIVSSRIFLRCHDFIDHPRT